MREPPNTALLPLGQPGIFEHVQVPPGPAVLDKSGPAHVSAREGKLADLGSLTAIFKHGPNSLH